MAPKAESEKVPAAEAKKDEKKLTGIYFDLIFILLFSRNFSKIFSLKIRPKILGRDGRNR